MKGPANAGPLLLSITRRELDCRPRQRVARDPRNAWPIVVMGMVPCHRSNTMNAPIRGLRWLLAILSVAAAPSAFAEDAAGCARQFETAQRMDMESFRDFDEETWLAGHDPRAVTVFASGAKRIGLDAIEQTMASHFANREAVWSWTELYRVVDGCRSAVILYDTVYEIPRLGFRQHALTSVTYAHEGNTWLSIADQGTLLPP
jgi:hypothetical protein